MSAWNARALTGSARQMAASLFHPLFTPALPPPVARRQGGHGDRCAAPVQEIA